MQVLLQPARQRTIKIRSDDKGFADYEVATRLITLSN